MKSSCEDLGVSLNWVKCPQDATAVLSMLSAGLIDMALMCTEDAVAFAANGSPVRICGRFTSAPRTFGVYTLPLGADAGRADPASWQGHEIGLPEEVGATLMLPVFAERAGWEDLPTLERRTFCTIRRACDWLSRGVVAAVVWEVSEAKIFVDTGCWLELRTEPMPWPSLVFVASKEALRSKPGAVRHFIEFSQSACDEFKSNRNTDSLIFLRKRHRLTDAQAEDLLDNTSWQCDAEVDEDTLARPLRLLRDMGLVAPTAMDSALSLPRLLAKHTRIAGWGDRELHSPGAAPLQLDGNVAEEEPGPLMEMPLGVRVAGSCVEFEPVPAG